MPKNRRKADYEKLWRSPKHLFPPTASSTGVDVLLQFEGEVSRIVLRDGTGNCMRISAGRGPHGLGLRIDSFRPVDVMSDDSTHIELCSYDSNPEAQSYKRWYRHEETPEDIAKLGEKYRRTS